MRRNARVLGLVAALAVGLVACGRPPRTEERPAARPPEGPTLPGAEEGVVARGSVQGTFSIPGPEGNPPELWRVSGKLIGEYAEGKPRGEWRNAEAVSQVPQYDVTVKAGRIRYALGDEEVRFDQGLTVTSPSRQATIKAEAAAFRIESQRFFVQAEAGRPAAVLTLADAVVDARRIEADMGLREVIATGLTARREGEGGIWRGKADTATVDEARNLQLAAPSGEISQAGGTVTFTAPVATWKPGLQVLNFNRGATLKRDGMSVRAAGATWLRAEQRIVTRGTTRLQQGRLDATGTSGAVDLAHQVASLRGIRSELDGMALRAGLGEVDEQGVLTLHDLTATVSAKRTTVTAPTASYDPASRKLTAPRGGKAVRDDATVTAGRVVWDGAADRFTASGQVKLVARGATVTGSTIQGPGDLSTATLTPCTAEGGAKGGRWRLRADRGSYAGGELRLSNAHGSFNARGRTATASSPQVRYDPGTRLVHFTGGFKAASPQDGVAVTSQRADYDPASGEFRAHGHVVATARGLRIRDEHWVYHVGGDEQGRLAHTAAPPEATAAERDPAAAPEAPPQREPPPGGNDLAVGTGDRPGHVGDQGSAVGGPAAADH